MNSAGESAKEKVVMNKKACLLIEEGPLYDILMLNAAGCDSLTINGVEFTAAGRSDEAVDPDDLQEPAILHPALAALANKGPLTVWVHKKIPTSILLEVRKVLQLIYEKYHTEGAVLVVYDMTTDTFETIVPKQTDSSTLCNIEPEDSQCWLSDTKRLAANFHSHPFGGHTKFLSSTDHVQAFAIPGAPIASFNFDPKPRIGNLYNFGEMECEFGSIPFQDPKQFTEGYPEMFELTQADRDRWQPLIDERVNGGRAVVSPGKAAGKSSFGKDGKSIWTPVITDDDDDLPATGTWSLQDYEAASLAEHLGDVRNPYAGLLHKGRDTFKFPSNDPVEDPDVPEAIPWSLDSISTEAGVADWDAAPDWVKFVSELAEEAGFDWQEMNATVNRAIEKLGDKFFPEHYPIPLDAWTPEAVKLLREVTMDSRELSKSEWKLIEKNFMTNIEDNAAFGADEYWIPCLVALYAISFCKISTKAKTIWEMFYRKYISLFLKDSGDEFFRKMPAPIPKHPEKIQQPDPQKQTEQAEAEAQPAEAEPQPEKPETNDIIEGMDTMPGVQDD